MSMMNKATLPMLVSNWIFGLGIIEYPPGNEYRTISFLYSSICLLGYCALAAYSYPYFLSMTKEFEASPAILKVIFYSNIFITIGTIVSGWKRSKGVRLMIRQTRNVDLLLEKIGVTVKYSKQFRIQLGLYMVRILFILILILINSYTFLSKATVQTAEKLAILIFNYPVVLTFVVDSTFTSFIICALRQFRKLNATLRRLLTSSEDCPQHKRVITAHLEQKISQIDQINCVEVDATYTLSTAKEAHLELVYLCKRVDETFDSHIIQTIMVAIAVTTGCLYQIFILLHPCIKIDGFDIGRVLLHNGTWVFYYILKIFIFSNSCATVVQEATSTGDIISEFYDEPSSTDKTREVIREFHCHLIRNVISFNPYGFIKIDFTLMKVVLGSVTTYLVIFSQFGNFIVPNNNNSTCI